MAKISIIIGAGFSYLAGFPLGVDIKNRFNRDLNDKILKYTGGEWYWIEDKNEAEISNGMMAAERWGYSYIFNEIIDRYRNSKGSFIDYEDFYQYCLDHIPIDKWTEDVYSIAKQKLIADNPDFAHNDHVLYTFEVYQTHDILDIINYLISDILITNLMDDDIKAIYMPFISFIKAIDEVHIFSLNHDTLLERILKIFEIEFSNGFGLNGSYLFYQNSPLEIYNSDFSKAVKLYKLHGSIDTLLFQHCEQIGNRLTYNGICTYFKPVDYMSRHYVVRKDLTNNVVVQDMNPGSCIPRFITGKNKQSIIGNDKMYAEMYVIFTNKIKLTDVILISGYSFRDAHINDEISKLDHERQIVINHNPSNQFPYNALLNYEIEKLTDLKEIQLPM